MDNLNIYNKVRVVPPSAQKEIRAGRLKGMTDINPMWRIKILTEVFGPCGIGWHPEIIDKRVEEGSDGQKVAVVDINLYVNQDGEWSRPIPGTGGSMLVANEKNGPYTSDEAFKMAYTDAISVSCKLLGVGADIYWQGDRTKYSETAAVPAERKPGFEIPPESDAPVFCEICGKRFADYWDGSELIKAERLAERSRKMNGKAICASCLKKGAHIGNNG